MDALYILGNGSLWKNQELRYSIRSLEKFAVGIDRLVVVGEDPGFLNSRARLYRIAEAKGPKEYRIAAKIAWACQHAKLSDEFLFLNDDHFLIETIDVATYPYYHKGRLKEASERKHNVGYSRALVDTSKALIDAGHPTLHFDIHTPIRYRRETFIGLANWWGKSLQTKQGLVVKSIYGNVTGVSPGPQIVDCKLKFPKSADDVRKTIAGRHVFSIADTAIRRGVDKVLREMFPQPSKWEA